MFKVEKKQYTGMMIARVIGVILFLIGLLSLLSSATHLRFIAYPAVVLFGIAGYYGFGALLLYLGIYFCFIFGKERKLKVSTRVTLILGLVFFSLFLACLLSGLEKLTVEQFLDELKLSFDFGSGGLGGNPRLAGGLIGYSLYNLWLSVGFWFPILCYVLLAVLSSIFLFWKLWAVLIASLDKKAQEAKKRRKEKEAEQKIKLLSLGEHEEKEPELEEKASGPALLEAPRENSEEKEPDYSFSFTRADTINLPKRAAKRQNNESSDEEKTVPSQAQCLKEPCFFLEEPVIETRESVEPVVNEAEKKSSPVIQNAAVSNDEVAIVPVNEEDEEPQIIQVQEEPKQNDDKSFVAEEPTIDDVDSPISLSPIDDALGNAQIKMEETKPEVEEMQFTLEDTQKEEVPMNTKTVDPISPEEEEDILASYPDAKPLPAYEFPPLSLLADSENEDVKEAMEAECQENTAAINDVFEGFEVRAHVKSHTIGPSVTRYDILCERDVSVTSLGKYIPDISVRLHGTPVRFSQTVAGMNTSGLEIANKTRMTISLKECIERLPDVKKKPYSVPFGVEISGDLVQADLSGFPHMLLAGTTGSGKSIFMHGLIMSLIMRNRPEDLRIIMIDPKRVELSKYKGLPHLLCPIIKEPNEAYVAMRKLVDEMERRFRILEEACVSNLKEFNTEYCVDHNKQRLPEIVVFVDEYADLVDSCKDIAEPILRIAGKARACGINLVIATQRPDAKIITGTIKSNLPVRVALTVKNYIDSNIIIGEGGAEALCGNGDMLVDCTSYRKNEMIRAQGCYVSNREITSVVEFIKSQQAVQYDEKFLDLSSYEEKVDLPITNMPGGYPSAPVQSAASSKAAADAELYETIKGYVMASDTCSISGLQRIFSIGFTRAGKMFTRLQEDGIISKGDAPGGKGVKVLIHNADNQSSNPGSLSNVKTIIED